MTETQVGSKRSAQFFHRVEFILLIAVITIPIFAVTNAIIETSLSPHEIPAGVVIAAAWLLLIVLWGVLAVVNGRRFRFRTRQLLFAVTLLALVFGPGLRYFVPYFVEHRIIVTLRNAGGRFHTTTAAPEWVVRLFGQKYFERADEAWFLQQPITDQEMAQIGKLKELRVLVLGGTLVTDKGLAHIESLPKLEFIDLPSNGNEQVTDKSFEHIGTLKHLRHIDAENMPITDASLAHLASLTSLEKLELGRTKVTDEGLDYLVGLKKLTSIALDRTNVTEKRIAKFRRQMPGVHISH